MVCEKFCACDLTRQTPLCAEIDFVDTVHQPFISIVNGLSRVESGLWMSPFRGIPRGPQVSRFDVVYLDDNCKVLGSVINFAESQFEPVPEGVASALILPAHTLGSFSIRPGDQMRICGADRIVAGGEESSVDAQLPFQCKAHLHRPAAIAAPVAIAQRAAQPISTGDPDTEQRPSFTVRFLRWVFPQPASTDRRRGERMSDQGLVAYYWTGGSPKSHPIENVSSSGLYLQTDERWLPGTRIVMTLQRRNAKAADADDTCRVESKVVRWGDDGVGCEFVESGFFDLNSGEVMEGQRFDREEFSNFLARGRAVTSDERATHGGTVAEPIRRLIGVGR